MPEAMYGVGAYRRDNGRFPEFRLVNMFVEKTRGSASGIALLDRPGLQSVATDGSGPGRAIYRRPGLFGGARFTVSGNGFFRDGVLIGTIAGDGPARMASSDSEIVVTRGGPAYSYDGTDFEEIDLDGQNVAGVAFLGGLFVFAIKESNKYQWSAVLDARTVDPLDFASAESAPDALLDVLAVGDNLYLLGEETIEVWYLTGDLFLPFSRITQRTALKGLYATGCAVLVDNALHFIGNDAMAYRMAEVPERLSDHGIEERISRAGSASAFAFVHEGHSFFAVRLDTGTWAIDLATSEWSEFGTTGEATWEVCAAAMNGPVPQFLSASGADVLEFAGTDDLGTPLTREFTAAAPSDRPFLIHSIELEMNAGTVEDDSEPVIEMRFSRDGGQTWSRWRPAKCGRTGRYRSRPRWRRLGMFDAPGALFHFRMTDPMRLRISKVLVNEPAAGRSR